MMLEFAYSIWAIVRHCLRGAGKRPSVYSFSGMCCLHDSVLLPSLIRVITKDKSDCDRNLYYLVSKRQTIFC